MQRAPGIPCALSHRGTRLLQQLGRVGVARMRSRVSNRIVAHPSRHGEDAAPQDEVVIRVATSVPHGEERGMPRVSNHEAVDQLGSLKFESARLSPSPLVGEGGAHLCAPDEGLSPQALVFQMREARPRREPLTRLE